MSNVVACYKWVINEADIKFNADQSVDFSKAKSKISEYDKNAIEAAVQVAKLLNGKAIGMTFGDQKSKPSLKDALSRNLDEACWINSDLVNGADGFVTSKALSAAVNKLEDVKMVICAEGSSDVYARQTAPRIGALLDWPVITSVIKMEINGNTLVAERKLEDRQQTVQVELPVVVAVLPEINEAPLPGLKAVLAASKKPVAEYSAADLGVAELQPKTHNDALKAYVMIRKNIMLTEGTAAEKIKALVDILNKEGLI